MDRAPKTDLVKTGGSSLVERTRELATLSEDDLRRFAAEAARDRDASALWALTEAHLTLHGSAGSRVSSHTLTAYRRVLEVLLTEWQGENLLRPGRNAGVLWIRGLEARFKPATVRVYLAGAKALYAALRWSGATDTAPFRATLLSRIVCASAGELACTVVSSAWRCRNGDG